MNAKVRGTWSNQEAIASVFIVCELTAGRALSANFVNDAIGGSTYLYV